VKPDDLATKSTRRALPAVLCAVISIVSAYPGLAQSIPYQREFPQSRTVVEKHLKELQPSSAGRLPVLEGFTVTGDRPLDRFQRGYYQCAAQVSAAPSGGSLVRAHATKPSNERWITSVAQASQSSFFRCELSCSDTRVYTCHCLFCCVWLESNDRS
jgi:hypothetical protein